METQKLLQEIQVFKEKLKEYRNLTENRVKSWNPSTPLDEKLETPKEEESKYEELKSELSQKLALFGEDLRENTMVVTYRDGKKVRERNGIRYLLALASSLNEERLEIYNFNIPEKEYYNKIWSIVLHGIEEYIGELKYFNEKQNSLSVKEKELKKKDDELRIKTEEVESLKKILKDSLEAVRQLPEIYRSKGVAALKKNHREIERYTNPNTKSQKSEDVKV
jgi:hypothetical protein